MIVVEGPDNAGKSTFAKKLGLTYRHPGPAPVNDHELFQCLKNQLELMDQPIVHDRVTCISHQIYNPHDAYESQLRENLSQMIRSKQVLFIYCRPPMSHMMNFAHHKAKDYDTEEHIKKIIDNQSVYIDRYDELFSHVPHISYDFTDEDMFHDNFVEEVVRYAHNQPNKLIKNLIGA